MADLSLLHEIKTELEMLYLSKVIDGYLENVDYKHPDRIIVNYLKLNKLIYYLSKYNLRSIKAKLYKKWLEILYYRKKKVKLSIVDLNLLKNKASLINILRKL